MALHKLKLDENGIWLDNMLLQGGQIIQHSL